METNPLELRCKNLQKYQVNGFYKLETKKQYFLINKDGLHIDLGYFIKYKNESIFNDCCWQVGPTYSKMQWHFEFSKMAENDDLKQELNLIECEDFYKKYDGFYEYPNRY